MSETTPDAVQAPSTPAAVEAPLLDVSTATTPAEVASEVIAETTVPPVVAEDTTIAGEVDESASASVDRTPLPPNPNAEQTKDCSSPLTDKARAKFADFERLGLVCVPPAVFNAILEKLPSEEDVLKDPTLLDYFAVIDEGREYLLRGNALSSSLEKPDGLWRQSVKEGAVELNAGRPRFGDNGDSNNMLTGVRAVQKLSASLGLGAIVQIPLWHTGIWVSMNAPSETELLELERRIGMEKVSLGRYTNGLIYSNASIYTNSYLINLALQKVYDATVKDISPQALKKIIALPDMQTLIWGLACTIWPNGYPFRQTCTVDPTTCQHVMEEMLNLSKLSWTNNRALSDYQRKHMSNRNAKVTAEQLARYQEEHKFQENRIFQIGENPMSVELKVPTIADYEMSGMAWVDGIVAQTDEAFGTTMSDSERNDYIVNQGKATAMRQYGHWVERLVLADDAGIIQDKSTIESAITAMSADGDLQESFFEGVGKYIDQTTVSMIAIPRYNCPSCQADPSADSKMHPHLVPLDVGRVFFTLLGQHIHKVVSRLPL